MLLKIAEPAVRADAEDPADTAELMAVLRLDRRALELWASRGLRLAAYAASKEKIWDEGRPGSRPVGMMP